MEDLYKQFEQLSLPSRVNWNEVTEKSLEKIFKFDELELLLNDLMHKDATAFQWRKLREASLISLKSRLKEPKILQFIIKVYEESVKFSVAKHDMAESHIAMTKLLDFYAINNQFNDSMLESILMFRFYNAADLNDGFRNLLECLQFSIPADLLQSAVVKNVLMVANACVKLDIFAIKKLKKKFSEDDSTSLRLLGLIEEKVLRHLAVQLPKAYSICPEAWIMKLLPINHIDQLNDFGIPPESEDPPGLCAMVKFQTRNFGDDSLGSEKMKIKPLGAGNEVGRSCIIVEFKGKRIMLDCGIHPAYSGMSALPFFDDIDPATIDVILITHFHLDHAAALPFFMERTNFKGKVYMTHPTKAIYKWLLSDYVKVSSLSVEEMLYDDNDLARSFERITAIDYHQEIEFEGIRFTAFNAGHVLGAAMFLVEVAGAKLLYTGDYSREEDRHLMAAEKPEVPLDILVCESTYGTQSQQPRLERERRFTTLASDIVRRGGRCLIPVFALGRAQELLLILDEYWQAHPELHSVPIYYASSLAKKCMAVYQTYVNMMNEKIRKQIAFSNPFIFKHISYLRGIESFEDRGPCVMMASPGMLQNGLSRELFERWCSNRQNGVIVAGYCVEGTLAKQILSEPKEIQALNGAMLPLRMSVEYISFSAHVDFAQNSQFIDDIHAPNLILVHGEQSEMMRLRNALQHRFESSPKPVIIFTPKNCETVELTFRGEKTVKILGSLASSNKDVKEGDLIDGILVGKDFEYQLVTAKDLPEFTQLRQVVFKQKQAISSQATPSLIEFHLVNLFGRTSVKRDDAKLEVMKEFTIIKSGSAEYTIEWTGNVQNDMIADSIISVIMNADYARSSVKETKSIKDHQHEHTGPVSGPSASLYLDVLKQYLIERFGQVTEDENEAKYRFEFEVKNSGSFIPVAVNMEDFAVECDHAEARETVEAAVKRISSLLDVDYII